MIALFFKSLCSKTTYPISDSTEENHRSKGAKIIKKMKVIVKDEARIIIRNKSDYYSHHIINNTMTVMVKDTE